MKPNKLTTLFLSVFFIGIINQFAGAQIVYTDITDVTLKCSHNSCANSRYLLDLNNDGVLDFVIYTNYSSPISVCHKCVDYSSSVDIYGAGNGVAVSTYANPSALVQGSEIGTSLTWDWDNGYNFGVLRIAWSDCIVLYVGCTSSSGNGGNWTSRNDRYLGLALILNNQTYYGWIRLSWVQTNSNQASCKILDYAFNSTPGQSINAGDTGSGSVSQAAINKEREEDIAPSKLNVTPNPVSSTATISFTLLQQEKVTLNLYDINGRLVNKIADREFSESVHWVTLDTKNLNAGIYLLKMQTARNVQTKKLVVVK